MLVWQCCELEKYWSHRKPTWQNSSHLSPNAARKVGPRQKRGMSREGSLCCGSLGGVNIKQFWIQSINCRWLLWSESGGLGNERQWQPMISWMDFGVFKSNHAHVISFLGLLFPNSIKQLFMLFGNKLGDLAHLFKETGFFLCQKLEMSCFHATVVPIVKNCPETPFLCAPYQHWSHPSCADMAERTINLTADYFSAAPGAGQRGYVGVGWEQGDVTADGQLMALPGWCPGAGGRALCQHGGLGVRKGMWDLWTCSVWPQKRRQSLPVWVGQGLCLTPSQAGNDGHYWRCRWLKVQLLGVTHLLGGDPCWSRAAQIINLLPCVLPVPGMLMLLCLSLLP